MNARKDTPFKTTHHFAYAAAAALLAGAALAVAVISILVFETGVETDEATMFRLAGLWIIVHFATQWIAARRVAHRSLPKEWQERLTRMLPFGVVVAVITRPEGLGLWAGITQLIGAWALLTAILLVSDWLLDTLWARYQAFRTARRDLH